LPLAFRKTVTIRRFSANTALGRFQILNVG
jgi:hypothetical protein